MVCPSLLACKAMVCEPAASGCVTSMALWLVKCSTSCRLLIQPKRIAECGFGIANSSIRSTIQPPGVQAGKFREEHVLQIGREIRRNG
jgi:hypothetical protein